jgi:hypothetical protein
VYIFCALTFGALWANRAILDLKCHIVGNTYVHVISDVDVVPQCIVGVIVVWLLATYTPFTHLLRLYLSEITYVLTLSLAMTGTVMAIWLYLFEKKHGKGYLEIR